MATFTIKFEGLVAHIGGMESKKHAAIVDDRPAHEPQIVIPGADLVPPQASARVIPLIDNDKITFNPQDLSPGTATCDERFMMLVPHLRELVRKGTLRSSVGAESPANGDGVVAFLRFPGGELTAPETLKHPVAFEFSDGIFAQTKCVPTGVLFTATPKNTTVRMSITSQPNEIVLRDSATIEVTNVSGSGVHFDEYGKLMDPGTEIANASEDKGKKCKASTAQKSTLFIRKAERQQEHEAEAQSVAGKKVDRLPPFGDPNPECSNSQWP